MLENESVCMSLITDSINGADVQAETDGHVCTSLTKRSVWIVYLGTDRLLFGEIPSEYLTTENC